MSQPDQAVLDRLLRGIDIPPCPAVLTALQREVAAPNASLTRIAQIINGDVSLAASVLKAANSPAFGLSRRVGNVAQAVPVLGMRTLSAITAGVALRTALSGGARRLERFWDSSSKTALLCARLTREFTGVPAETAYTFGLFHDCGIPVLIHRFPDYLDTLQLANGSFDLSFTEVEERRHATHHAAIGTLLTRNWGLPEDISTAILLHHDLDIFRPDADHIAARARTLVALGALASYFVGSSLRMSEDPWWIRGRPLYLAHLGLGDKDFLDLRETAFEAIESF
ncbi:MAG TPA: HDOD domain-containing protein [Zoogloea sp.]|uniref:HDOD domain-containing protein n=1 Tax=Zoogloea sp. TaxID=49181 RepID=UPI002D0BFDF2|nr:HDOD domain-containing protein [Zoogloea sp.]HMV17043.1 HDOD domain-containing protein [Rhodocyclaceae bacterium]HMW53100.1 HDOD domain-containing protein [Rhodocyclaceae bacterium]HMY49159.1 HDOD domain-containing protein [Rhodocyclaceae bacterium]HMZ76080.1 HDOD domain-containing protein [Rhodocyclaceae bacterium]HNA68787.1 HDOD domain-containing protein [Rhodocyclaceae bacterium]